MGKGRPRKAENGVLGGNLSGGFLGGSGSLKIPAGPVFYPSEEEFKDPLEYIYKIRPEAEPYGICKIVPPASWKSPFALDMDTFTFPTKTQAIHQLQARCASCDPKTFALEYHRFLEEHCHKKASKRVVFEGEDLDLCKLFNTVKRFGWYDKVVETKKWGEVFRFVRPGRKVLECSKHVLSQLYREHLYDYEEYYCLLNKQNIKSSKRTSIEVELSNANVVSPKAEVSNAKRRRKNKEGEIVKVRYLEEKDFGQICEQCRSGLHGEVMLLCDRCNKGWHIYCLSPPLKRIPPGNWYCLECVNSEKDTFGFVPGKEFSLESFRRMAERVKKKWYGSSATSRVQLEKKFWEIVEGSVGQVEVIYGSDLDTFVYGSGFPRHTDDKPSSLELDIWNKYCDSPWNLSNLPRLQGSMLKTVHQNIAGVMVPWLYIGMLFSSFCWHFEDHCFYSMNYHHWGEPKCWYSVPGNEADAFEKVMRDSLPDLFEAQPDLLFQLVTMLNPSVLQEKGVPVYSIIQEPGNFVITFPRSYHGGFNFGLNCAEAVNFAPADWLPHGGFGAELYRHYHKAAVLSHEELLCVVAKNECDSRTASYLKKELLRIYTNEKNWRERLWRNGVVRSSIMTPRKQPEYVGTEEDPMCVICQQLLYLSAVSCKCRPLAFVCLQHSEHLCECKAVKHCIFYRHTLSELNDLLVKADKHHSTEAAVKSSKELHFEKAIALAKKVKGGHVTHVQLAEEWILRSCRILEQPYSRDAYSCVIEEAEQFLWAGSEMDVVRDIESKLIQAQKWAEDVRACVSRVKLWSNDKKGGTKRVKMAHLDKLLSLHEVPCIEPNSLHLQEYQEKASKLIEEINSALSPSSESSMADWETLYLRVSDLPIKVKESETLKNKLLAVKVWVEGVRMCIVQKSQSSIEVDKLYKLESEMLELQYHCEEADLLTALITRVKTCRSRCNEVLKKSTSLKEVQFFLSEWEDFTVNIPELELLRKYCSDAISWISRVKNVLVNVREREDQENVVDELTCIRRDGSLLQIQVDDFPHLGLELEKARCRVKAFKAMGGENAMEFIQQLISEATVLHIEKEKIFGDVSGRYELAIHWEEKAKHVLSSKAQMTEFEDVLRASEDIGITPPSLQDTKDAVSTAKTWLIKSKPFLCYNSSISATSEPSLKLDDLEGLVVESKHLKVHLEESSLLDEVLNKCLRWKKNASSLLQDLEHLWSSDINGESNMNCFIHRFNSQIFSMESAIKVGTSIGLELDLIPILRDSCCLLNWCIKALSFSDLTPTHKEVEIVWNAAASLPSMNKDSTLMDTVMEALNWLNKSTEILDSCHHGQFEMSSVKEVLAQSKKIKIPFQNIIGRLEDAIKSHNLWLDQVHLFFSFCSEDRSWISMLQLKERGNMEAFACEELEKVLSEVEKVQCWKQQCRDIIKPVEENPLLSALTEIKSNVERSLDVHSNYKNDKVRNSFICCSNAIEDQKVLTCSICKDSLHLDCSKQLVDDSTMFVCKYCEFMNNSKFPRNGLASLKTGQKHLEMDKLVMLISDANDHCLWTDERRVLNHIVDRAHASSACSKELVDFSLAYLSDDLDVVTQNMCIALKAMDVAGIYDAQVNRNFELALARNLWKLQSDKLLRSKEKSTIQKIRHQLKEGLAINIHPEDYFMQKLMEFRDIGLQWVDRANKVSMDGGVLPLHGVFELISEGENLPVSCGKELKLLRDRSMLYCICRRPYDKRAMIACDSCDEWYHFDCINISSAPKFYICPACNHRPREEIFASVPAPLERCGAKFEEPQTPLRRSELRRSSQKAKCDSVEAEIHRLGSCSDSDSLMWRNRKPFRRVARKRSEMKSLSPFFYDSNKM